ncbi:hypothetical protein FA15DRAFT_753910 [Coprinopsis marcescibilis]|uniref:DUF6589 domain-containing protein n=1 Tax=Coprinopsis marcescibilis TaxID=230819 RepID=A0A5C3L542_COPMA|nr:hypothetical protein FA15DRAFT_753910 [Coprinopsis marcescibilis]
MATITNHFSAIQNTTFASEFTDDEGSTASSESASDISDMEGFISAASNPAKSGSNEEPINNIFHRTTASKRTHLTEQSKFEAVHDTCKFLESCRIRDIGMLAKTSLRFFVNEAASRGSQGDEDACCQHCQQHDSQGAQNPRASLMMMKQKGPVLWRFLKHSLTTKGQKKRNTVKDPSKTIFTIISMMVYSQSHHHNRLQKLLAIYLKFRGISAKGFNTLHSMGLTMSHKWACNIVESMSRQAGEEMLKKMEEFMWVSSYNNVNIPFRVFSQCLDNQRELGTGTAATIYIKRDAPKLSDTLNQLLKEQQACGIKNPLTEADILNLDSKDYPKVHAQMKHAVLQILLDSPEFELSTYLERTSDKLKSPLPINPLPVGHEHATLQYLLGTVDIPEASYEDHSRLLTAWFEQLGFKTTAEKIQLAIKNIITWIGNQLTVNCLRHLFTFRANDDNSFDCLDFLVFIFGWLHLQMAFAKSLHAQYLGTSKGQGLGQAFELLNKKGLFSTKTQGPFHHDLEELKALASNLVKKYASSDALENNPTVQPDQQRRQVTMWNWDALQYIVLDQAIKTGDVGLMEAMLPSLLFQFLGGGNGKSLEEDWAESEDEDADKERGVDMADGSKRGEGNGSNGAMVAENGDSDDSTRIDKNSDNNDSTSSKATSEASVPDEADEDAAEAAFWLL